MNKLINEGGNVFTSQEDGSATIRIKKADVDPTLIWLGNVLGIEKLEDFKLGTTGKKETSGDLDIAIDKNKVSKDDLDEKLMAWVNENHPELELAKLPDAQKEYDRWWSIKLKEVPRQNWEKIKKKREIAKKELERLKTNKKRWIARSGTSVHFKTPIRGDESNGFVQTDLMFGNPEFMLWSVQGEPEGSGYRGRDRQLLINAIATAKGYAWNAFFGLTHRTTGEEITDKQEVVNRLLGPGHKPEDFKSIYTLFDIISNKEKYPDEVYEKIREKAGFEFPHRDEALNEAKKDSPRIQHAEDLIFFEGSAGAMRALDALEKMNNPEIRPETFKTSVKWDGSPAVYFGRDREGNFVFTDKGGFGAKVDKGRANSKEEIDAMYRARSERAAKKSDMTAEEIYQQKYSKISAMMQKAFDLIEKSLKPDHRGYFFGEVLYFNKPQIEDGKFVFKPNMIKYKVDTESEMGKEIANSDVGIVVHSEKDVDENPILDDDRPLDLEPLAPPAAGIVFFGKTFIKKPVNVDDAEVQSVKQLVSKNSTKIDDFFNTETLKKLAISDLSNLFYTYLNGKVDTGLEDLGSDFIEWINSKGNISPQKKQNVENYIENNKEAFDVIWEIVSRTMKIKDDVIANIDTQGGLPFSQSLGDEEVGEGYVLSSDGNLIKLVDRSKFTRANRSVVREQNKLEAELEDLEDTETHVFIPGGFKPPHKGHLSLLLQAIQKYPDAIVHITSGPTKRAEGGLEISAEQAKQVWKKYIEKYGINNEVDLDYFEPFKTNRKKGDGKTTIISSSPFLRIGLRMENDIENIKPNSKIVAVSSEDPHINFIKNAVNYLNDKKENPKNFTFESLKPETIDVEKGRKLSATDMRKAISKGNFEEFKEFMPEKLSEEDAKEVFELLGGNLKETTMASGAVTGSARPLPFTSDNKKDETIYKEQIQLRQIIRKVIIQEMREKQSMITEEKQLRDLIRHLIKEIDNPTKSTGLNKLIQALKIALPTIESSYKSLTTNKEQRESFKQHYLKAIIDTLSPQDAIRSASGGESVGLLGGSALEEQEGEDVNVNIEEDPTDLSADIEEKETDQEQQINKDAGVTLKDIEGKKTDVPLPQIPGLDETGRDESVDAYKKTVDAITRNYRTLHNENDRKEFKDYLITNLLLYFDKFENDISPESRSVTTPEYEKQKAEKEQFISREEQPISETIKKAIKETLKNKFV